MKKYYLKPSMRVVEMKHKRQILAGSDVTSVDGDTFKGNITGSKEPARAPQFDSDEW